MINKVVVPHISANVTDATVTAWHKKEGEPVKKGEPLVELTTEKAAFDLDAPHSGILRRILAPVKSMLPEKYVLALIGEASDPLPDVDTFNKNLLKRYAGKPSTPARQKNLPADRPTERVRATPAARRLAREHSLDLAGIATATGAEVITEEILNKYLATRK